MTEVSLYVLLAAVIAGVVLVAAGHPIVDVAVVGGAAVALVIVVALVSRRAGRPVSGDAPPQAADQTDREGRD